MISIHQAVPIGWEAQVHRETYIAVLQSHLRRRGAKQAFAHQVGITPQYLSYLLDPFNHRTPSPETAASMTRALDMSEHERAHVLEHMILASEREKEAQVDMGRLLNRASVQERFEEIKRLNAIMQFGQDPQQARAARRIVAEAGRMFLRDIEALQYPVYYAQVSLMLHELNSVLAQHSRALYYAKRVRSLLSNVDPAAVGDDASVIAVALTNATRLEAVAYCNLKLPRSAYQVLDEAERTPDARARPGMWLPHIYRDKLQNLAQMPRPSIGEAEALALRGLHMLERSTTSQAGLQAIMLERSLSNVYLYTERYAQAVQILQRLSREVETTPQVGTLHRMLVLKDYAHALWHRGERLQWADVLGKAVELATEAGFTHQLLRLREYYASLPREIFALLAPCAQSALRPEGQAG